MGIVIRILWNTRQPTQIRFKPRRKVPVRNIYPSFFESLDPESFVVVFIEWLVPPKTKLNAYNRTFKTKGINCGIPCRYLESLACYLLYKQFITYIYSFMQICRNFLSHERFRYRVSSSKSISYFTA